MKRRTHSGDGLMPRAMVLLMTLLFVLPSDGPAQAVPGPGDRIRITQMDGAVLTGTLDTWSEETVQLSVDSAVQAVPVETIDVLETSLGQQRRFGKYIAITMVGGALVGGVAGALSWQECSSFCFGPSTQGEYIAIGVAGGALIGLPVGVLLAIVLPEERWQPVGAPATAESGLTVRPVIGRGVGLAGSVRFGGF